MKELWNERYSSKEYMYGTEPNRFFKESLKKLDSKGKLLLPAEGEGRNAVYAAEKGFAVTAFDISEQARNKALELAVRKDVDFEYQLGSVNELNFKNASFDVAALIYAHMPTGIRTAFHKKITELLVPGGMIILEGFSKNNLERRLKNPRIGGPDNPDMLFSVEDIEKEFPGFDVKYLEECEIELSEGLLHNGKALVVRFVGLKK